MVSLAGSLDPSVCLFFPKGENHGNHGKWSLICWLCNVVYPISLGPYWLPLNYSIIQLHLLLIPIFCYRSHCYILFTNTSQHQTYCLIISNELWSKLALFFEDSPGTSRSVEASESQAEHDKMLRKVRAEGSMVMSSCMMAVWVSVGIGQCLLRLAVIWRIDTSDTEPTSQFSLTSIVTPDWASKLQEKYLQFLKP